jgi:protocatechuate 3,4-dioxygenase beta subunit
MRPWLSVLLAAALVLLPACSDDDGPAVPEGPTPVTGQVLDPDGQPLAGAGIVLEFEAPFLARPATRIHFSVAEPGPVLVWVTAQCRPETLKVLFAGEAPAGTLSVIWDATDTQGRRVPDGLYRWHVLADGTLSSNDLMLFLLGEYPADADPADWVTSAMTDQDGRFHMEQACLPFDHEITATDEHGDPISVFTVGRRVRFHAMHADFPVAASTWYEVDPGSGCDVQLIFPRP